MISNLPIIAGDKIKLVFLQAGFNKQSILGQSGYVYSTGLLSPAFLAISGKYDDYGSIEDVDEDWNYKVIESTLKEKFGNVIITDDEEFKDWGLLDLIRGIERAGSFRNQPQYYDLSKTACTDKGKVPDMNSEKKDCDLSWVMIRQDVWDMCVDLQSKSLDYWNIKRGEDKTLPYYISGSDFGDRTFDAFIQKIKKVFTDPVEQMRHELMSDLGIDHIFGSHGRDSKLLMFDYKSLCKKNRDDDEFLGDIKKKWFEQIMIEDCISNLRKGWVIQPGGGSQAQDWELYKKFNIGLNSICDIKLEEY